MTISVRTITAAQHLAYLETLPSASFLQTPAWAQVKSEWRNESVGWFDDAGSGEGSGADTPIGVGLVLYRQLPKVRRYLAYLPEGPVVDWTRTDLAALLTPLRAHLAGQGAFGVRIGPTLVKRRWSAATIKAAVADDTMTRLTDAPPDASDPGAARAERQLMELGWLPPKDADGFSAGQPPFNFWLPIADRTPDELLKGMNQLWRRNIKKADKAGVGVTIGTADDLPAFHALYAETAERDHFTPRPLVYFTTMYAALRAEDPDRIRLYLARHEGDLVAATIWVRVGDHAWYSYGASSTAKREVRASNAIQWRMIRDAQEAGASVYDLRGVTPGIGPDDPEVGLIQFKVGTGGEIVEYLGEWDLPINKVLYKAFDWYLRRRG